MERKDEKREKNWETTLCAVATPMAVSALSLIRMSGPKALDIANKVFVSKQIKDLRESPGYACYYGKLVDDKGEVLDQIVLSVFLGPHSYTGEDSVEFSCHGSLYVQQAVLDLLISKGAQPAGPGAFSQRAFLNGKMDLTQLEGVADLIAAESEAAHNIAVKQMRGGFSKELRRMRASLLELASLVELELDFSEEDLEFASREHLNALVIALQDHIKRLCDSFRLGNVIKNGIPVAIVGAVNAGKSTLLNAILGEDRAIVSDIEGTTRDTIEDSLVIEGIRFRFIDTAGLRSADGGIEQLGIERSYEKIRSASMLILVLDPVRGMSAIRDSIDRVAARKSEDMQDILVVFNKTETICDKVIVLEDNDKISNDFTQYYNKYVLDNNIVVVKQLKDIVVQSIDYINSLGMPISSVSCISALAGRGVQEIKTLLAEAVKPRMQQQSTTLLTNVRHYQALLAAGEALARVRRGLGIAASAGPVSSASAAPLSAADSPAASAVSVSAAPLSAADSPAASAVSVSAAPLSAADSPAASAVSAALLSAADSPAASAAPAADPPLPTDLLAQDLREALFHIGSITGEITTDEILGNIFSKFCIGK